MINTEYLAEYFTNLMNSYGVGYGKHFKIFADEGELKKAVKSYGKSPINFTSGIVEIVGSQLVKARDLRLNTYMAQITLFIDLALNGLNEDKESLNLIDIRKVLTEMIDEENGKTGMSKGFNQTVSYSYPTNGTKSDVGFISDCLPIYLSCNVVLFEDGVNANDCNIYINGEDMGFTRAVFTRQRTADSQTFNRDISQKTTMQAQGLSVDLVAPALRSKQISKLIMKDVLFGGNYALNVKIETPLGSKNFIAIFGNNQASLDLATNVGYNVSVVEGVDYLLDYDYVGSKWAKYKATEDNFELVLGTKSTVYWGDDVIEELEAGTHTHNYSDKKQHTIYVFGG